MVDYGDTLGMQQLTDYGTQFVSLPESVQIGIVKIANEKYDQIAAGDPFFAKVLKSQREFLTAYRAMKSFAQPDPNLMEEYK
jgi:TRAP-type mannitol/chloroaromatic compound transport system substrate-binding protein